MKLRHPMRRHLLLKTVAVLIGLGFVAAGRQSVLQGSVDAGAVMAMAGCVICFLIGMWLAADLALRRWSRGLPQAAEGQVFEGRTPRVLCALIGAPLVLVALGVGAEAWLNEQRVSLAALALAAFGLVLYSIGLWRSRRAIVLNEHNILMLGDGRQASWPLADVQALGFQERRMRGGSQHTYRLHMQAAAKPVQLGDNVFMGGLHASPAFGAALRTRLRDQLSPRLAEQVNAGDAVAFGPLWAGRAGLAKSTAALQSGDVLKWDEVHSALVKRDALHIKRKGQRWPWAVVPLNKLLNRDVLVHWMENGGPPAFGGDESAQPLRVSAPSS